VVDGGVGETSLALVELWDLGGGVSRGGIYKKSRYGVIYLFSFKRQEQEGSGVGPGNHFWRGGHREINGKGSGSKMEREKGWCW